MNRAGPVGSRPDPAVLLVPAAGTGSRLGSPLPKVLTPVAGRPMIDYLFDLYAPVVNRFVVVVQPGMEDAVRAQGRSRGVRIDCDLQPAPTGMLDAILAPLDRIRTIGPAWVWITWCDQVAVLPETVAAVQRALVQSPSPQLVLPTCRQQDPYIHFVRDENDRITGLRQRREGDEMPASGESDAGVFVLARDAYTELLPEFARGAHRGSATGERNFLPFVAWLSRRCPGSVKTLACREPIESIGINTPGDLRRIEEHLFRRTHPGRPPSSS